MTDPEIAGRRSFVGRMTVLGSGCVLAWLVVHGAVAALEPAELLTRIRGSSLVPAEAVALRNVELEMGPATCAPSLASTHSLETPGPITSLKP